MNTPETAQAVKPDDKPARFVQAVMRTCRENKGYAARLKRADNPSTEYQSWETLASFGINLERDHQRLPYVSIAAAMAKAKSQETGNLTLGRAIASCYEDGNQSDQAKTKLRRLLACDDVAETCRILRPLFSLINSRISQSLNFTKILKQLLRFRWDAQAVKAQWAQEFFSSQLKEQETE